MNFLDNLLINSVDNTEYLPCPLEGLSSRSVYKKSVGSHDVHKCFGK